MGKRVTLSIDLPASGNNNLVREVHRQVRNAILDGRLAPRSRLPSTREFAEQFGISRNSVLAVYDLLLSEGYLVARPGSGTFVADTAPAARQRRPVRSETDAANGSDGRLAARMSEVPSRPQPAAAPHDLQVGLPDISAIPFDIWRRLSDRALRQFAREPAGYAAPQGQFELRTAIASHLSRARAISCSAADVVVTAGAQQAFGLLAKTLVVPAKTVVAVEQLFYPPMREAMLAAGAKVVTVPIDAEGLRVDLVPHEARIICVTPSHQFPTGVAMSPRRRVELMRLAAERDAVVIEDDYDSEFRFSGRPLDALLTLDRAESVFYVGTFSKSLFPALRLGFVVVPAWARETLVRMKQLADWHSPVLEQDTLAAFITGGYLERHVRTMRSVYRERRDALLAAITQHAPDFLEPIPSHAGLHLGVWLRSNASASELASRAVAVGINPAPFSRFAEDPRSTEEPNGMALGYSLVDAARMNEVVRKLVRLIQELQNPGHLRVTQ